MRRRGAQWAREAVEAFEELRSTGGDPQLEAVKTAVFLEDVFGVTLSDEDIDAAVLSGPDGMRAAVERARAAAERAGMAAEQVGTVGRDRAAAEREQDSA